MSEETEPVEQAPAPAVGAEKAVVLNAVPENRLNPLPPPVADNPALGIYSQDTIASAYHLYISTSAQTSDVATKLGIPENVVRSWALRFKWTERKKELEQLAHKEAEDTYRAFLRDNRLVTSQRHLEAATEAEMLVLDLLRDMRKRQAEGSVDTLALKRLTEALSSATGVSARAVGLGDGQSAAGAGQHNQIRPMIVLGVTPMVPTPGQVIDIVD